MSGRARFLVRISQLQFLQRPRFPETKLRLPIGWRGFHSPSPMVFGVQGLLHLLDASDRGNHRSIDRNTEGTKVFGQFPVFNGRQAVVVGNLDIVLAVSTGTPTMKRRL